MCNLKMSKQITCGCIAYIRKHGFWLWLKHLPSNHYGNSFEIVGFGLRLFDIQGLMSDMTQRLEETSFKQLIGTITCQQIFLPTIRLVAQQINPLPALKTSLQQTYHWIFTLLFVLKSCFQLSTFTTTEERNDISLKRPVDLEK